MIGIFRSFRTEWLAAVIAVAGLPMLARAEVSVEQSGANVRVLVDGQLFAEYVTDGGPKPFVWPIYGPTGKAMTRAYPMKDVAGEKPDHPHQRSLWFTHGKVNDIDFWAEQGPFGSTKHREYVDVSSDSKKAVISTRNDWLAPDGTKQLEDRRTLTFRADGERRAIEFDITLTASEGPVTFGDTKEGMFGVRIPTSMDVDQKPKGKPKAETPATLPPGGTIVTSEGLTNEAAWGKPARWVDYHGMVDGEHLGIAIVNHPSSFRYPTPWHVRTYGLFAANPFGLHDFDPKSGVDGAHTIEKGESIRFRYLVLFHKGDEATGSVEQVFEQYSKRP